MKLAWVVLVVLLSACTVAPISSRAQSDRSHLALAQEYLQQGQLGLAQQALLSVTPATQETSAYRRLKALYLLRNREVTAAIDYHQESLQLAPNDDFLMNNLGVLLAQQGQYDAACELYQKAVLISAYRSPSSLINLARCALRQEDVNKAWKLLHQAKEIALLPDIGLLTELNLVLIRNDLNRARQINNIIQADTAFARNQEHVEEFECLSRQVLARESDLTSNSLPSPIACIVQGIKNNE